MLFHEAVNDETDGRIEVCVPATAPGADGGTLAAGPVASILVAGVQAECPAILSAYDAVADWA